MGNAMAGTKKRWPLNKGAVSIHLRLEPQQLASVDSWIAHQPDSLSRPEAVRQLVDKGLLGQ
jgi:hypothetical protein